MLRRFDLLLALRCHRNPMLYRWSPVQIAVFDRFAHIQELRISRHIWFLFVFVIHVTA